MLCAANPSHRSSPFHYFLAAAAPGAGFADGFPQKIMVPRLVEVTTSIAPSLFKSTASTVDPTPERLCINSGLNSAPPGAFGLRTVLNQYKTPGPNGSGSL